MKGKDYYDILSVSENASADEIKKAYRTIAKENHPDRKPGDKAAAERFKAATEAYETLSDPEKRAKYDQLRKLGATGGGRGFRYRTHPGSNGGGRPSGDFSFDDDYASFMRDFGTQSQKERFGGSSGGDGGLDDLLSSLFGGGARSTASEPRQSSEPQPTDDPFFKRKGSNAYCEVPINIAQALLGSKVRVRTPGGQKVTLKIPAGIEPETSLRVSGMGYRTPSGNGDLYVKIHVAIPRHLTEEQKENARALAESLGLKW